tara:strand:+ start:7465 stop:8103 length:639 start_codon:yes stop_codon:yes gene_type:complete
MLEEYECEYDSDSTVEQDLEPNIPIVNKNNPYIIECNENEYGLRYINSSTTPVKYKPNQIPIYIPNNNYILSQEIEYEASIVKGLSIMDFIANISYTIYGFYYPILLCIISCCGYSGADSFDKKKIYFYLIYSYAQLLCKMYILSYLIVLAVNYKIKEQQQSNFPNYLFLKNLKMPIILSSVLLTFQVLITKYVYSFYKKIPNTPQYNYMVL